MRNNRIYLAAACLFLGCAASVSAQTVDLGAVNSDLSHFRARDKRGVNVFEDPKEEGVTFDGVKGRVGGQFALQWQGLNHSNTAAEKLDPDTGENLNELVKIDNNFNLATANMDIDVQLAKGVRSHLRTYLSSRHHNEPYVKDGYLLVDSLDLVDEGFLSGLMEYVTIKLGHMEVNYGDLHFRRSDNAQGIYNPFIGNTIMDSFSTEVGAEVYARANGFLAMVGASNGKLNQNVADGEGDGVSVLGKLGWDEQVTDDLRLRFTGSVYNTAKSAGTRLYAGDRAGSRYYYVTEHLATTSQFRSGRFDPALKNKLTAIMFNAFAKFQGLEVMGTYENADGRDNTESKDRAFDQYVAEVVYRFGSTENYYAGARYNLVQGPLKGKTEDVTVDRWQFGLGWYLTNNMLGKLEYVDQQYSDFPSTDILNGAEFKGFMVESVIAF